MCWFFVYRDEIAFTTRLKSTISILAQLGTSAIELEFVAKSFNWDSSDLLITFFSVP